MTCNRGMILALFAALSFKTALVSGNDARHNLIAPQVIREGVWDKVIVNLHGISGSVDVVGTLKTTGMLKYKQYAQDPKEPIALAIMQSHINGEGGPFREAKYVHFFLKASYNSSGSVVFEKDIKMRLLDTSGYIYVQTDRPIYRPNEVVRFRVAALRHDGGPAVDKPVEIVIRSPLDNMVVKKEEDRMKNSSFIEHRYVVPEYPVIGAWSIEARYKDEIDEKWSGTKFQVQKYVLPTFNVRVSLHKAYILVNTKSNGGVFINGTIYAEYSYGKKVSGSFFLSATLQRRDTSRRLVFYQMPSDYKSSARILDGMEDFKILIKPEDVEASLQDLAEEEATVSVAVSLTGEDEGLVESATSHPIPFVTSPYKIDLSKTSKYFTPGATFKIRGTILDSVSLKPVPHVPVMISRKGISARITSDQYGQISKTENFDGKKEKKRYELWTVDPSVSREAQASAELELEPYQSTSDSILVLQVESLMASGSLEVGVTHSKSPGDLRYITMARGYITSSGVHKAFGGSTRTSIVIEVTGDMTPSFRLLVYFLRGTEIVSNSLWVDVGNKCSKELEIILEDKEVLPGAPVNIRYKGPANATVGVSAVDRAAYFLYNGSRLTRDEVFRRYGEYDRGCVREGGRDARHVFEEAGLQIVGGIYNAKEDFSYQCRAPVKERKRRDLAEQEAKWKMESDLNECRLDGYLPNHAGESCIKRKSRVLKRKSKECAELFFEACMNMTGPRFSIGRSSGSSSATAMAAKANGVIRKEFKETMLWDTIILSPQGESKKQKITPHSITTFEFDAISVHSKEGFCAAKTKTLLVFKKVFIQLQVPYSLKRMEQAEIRATLFNYGDSTIENIDIQIKLSNVLCSHFKPDIWHKLATLLRVKPNKAASTSFVVMPLRVPEDQVSNPVEIVVSACMEGEDLDRIQKSVLVEEEGAMREFTGTKAIDLKAKGESMKQDFTIQLEFPEKFIPGSRKCKLFAYTSFMGPNLERDPVSKKIVTMKDKLYKPYGCGEQNIVHMGPLVYAYRYLIASRKMDNGTQEAHDILNFISAGYYNQWSHVNWNQRAWAIGRNKEPSTWLCAYVNKVMSQARKLAPNVIPDNALICSSMRWILNQQESDGGFAQGRYVGSSSISSLAQDKFTRTAYILISLVETKYECSDVDTTSAIDGATNYLTRMENGTELARPYALAITTYALTISKTHPEVAKRLWAKLKKKVQYSEDYYVAFWQDDNSTGLSDSKAKYYRSNYAFAVDVEITAYALLSVINGATNATLTQEVMDLSRKAVLWLIQQRNEKGAFKSTQDTVIALQALSEYMIWINYLQPHSGKTSISLNLIGAKKSEWQNPASFQLTDSHETAPENINVPPLVIEGTNITVQATGSGEASLSHRCTYRVLSADEVDSFEVNVTVKNSDGSPIKETPEKATIKISMRNPTSRKTGQVIVEVNLVSGYVADVKTLDLILISNTIDGIVDNYETANQKVILYLSGLTSEKTELAFHIKRVVKILNPEPATITVYDYYEPSIQASVFYSVRGEQYAELQTTESCKTNKNSEFCRCAEGGCMKCRTRDDQKKSLNCATTGDYSAPGCFDAYRTSCDRDYVYEITITKAGYDKTDIFVEFEGRINDAYKTGNDFDMKSGNDRKFIVRDECLKICQDDEALNESNYLNTEGTYLVMGKEPERVQRNGVDEYIYMLDKDVIIERLYPYGKVKNATLRYEKKCKGVIKAKNVEKCKKYETIMEISNSTKKLTKDVRDEGCET